MKEPETALEPPDSRYRSIVEDHPNPICRFLPDGTLTFVNRAFREYFDREDDHVIGSSIFEFIGEERLLQVRERLAALRPDQPVLTHEQEVFTPGGTQWRQWTLKGIFDPQGRLREIQSVWRDITDRKLAEMDLLKSQQRYRKLITSIPDGVVAYDPQGEATYVNDGFVHLYGWTQEDLLSGTIDFVPSEEVERTLEAWQKTFGGEKVSFETKRRTKTGGILDIQLRTASLRDRHGHITENIVIHRDITEMKRAQEELQRAHDELELRVTERTAELSRANEQLRREIMERKHAEGKLRESEERLRTVFETAQDCIFLKNRNLVYTHVNPAFLKALELRDMDVIGKTDESIFGPHEAAYINDLESRVLTGEIVGATYNVSAGGMAKTLNCIRVPIRNHSGEPIGICGIARDVTEQKALERRCVRTAAGYRSGAMEVTLNQLRVAAESESIVLLLGESGSGKDYLAQYLHDHSGRAGGPFFGINCAALAASVAESELFGHEPGSFTGSRGRKRGLLEMAEGGTLLLNEIGELSQELQGKLLTFLDTQSFTRVGGEKTVRVNARIVAATNRDLETEVAGGTFREDLYYRLNVLSIRVPPLRERLEDIPFLAEDLLATLANKLGLHAPPSLDTSALESLGRYRWPGNVRELRNILERALISCRAPIITSDDLVMPKGSAEKPTDDREIPVSVTLSDKLKMNEALDEAKRIMIETALKRRRGNVSSAARLLGISRDSLRYHIKVLRIP